MGLLRVFDIGQRGYVEAGSFHATPHPWVLVVQDMRNLGDRFLLCSRTYFAIRAAWIGMCKHNESWDACRVVDHVATSADQCLVCSHVLRNTRAAYASSVKSRSIR